MIGRGGLESLQFPLEAHTSIGTLNFEYHDKYEETARILDFHFHIICT